MSNHPSDGPAHAPTILDDECSQVLLLKDAADCGDAAALVSAFGAVARTRGLMWVASRVGVERTQLFSALSDPSSPNIDFLQMVVRRLRSATGSDDDD